MGNEQLLLNKKVKPTAMRLLTLAFLKKQTAAASITDLENEFDSCDRITLYRTLKTFEKQGLIHSITEGAVVKYAMCDNACTEEQHTDTHLHFYCTNCRKTICLQEVKIPKINTPSDFQVTELNLVAKGLCKNCLQ